MPKHANNVTELFLGNDVLIQSTIQIKPNSLIFRVVDKHITWLKTKFLYKEND